MNVSELITLLGTVPGHVPVGVLTVAQTGIVVDVETAPVVTIEQTIADDGAILTVWVTGVGEPTVAPPTLITWPCPCGQLITVDPHAIWPDDHDDHGHGPGPAP